MTPEEQEYLKNIAIIAAGAGVLGGATISAIAVIYNGWRQRIADAARYLSDSTASDIRHFRELAMDAAIAEWKQQLVEVQRWDKRHSICDDGTERPLLESLDLVLVKKLKLMQTFGDGTISYADLPRRIREFSQFIKIWESKTETRTNEDNEQDAAHRPG